MKSFNSLVRIVFVVVLIISAAIGNSKAQRLKEGPQDLCFFSKVDETDQPYAVYVPYNFDESKEYPLVVFLHGAWSNHRLGLRRAFGQGNNQGVDFITPGNVPAENDLEASRYWPEMPDAGYIVAAPLARGTAGYQGIPEQDVYEMLDDLKCRFKIDEDRIYLTGLSMGGGGTTWLGLTRPDVWAAIAPVCPAPPEEANELYGNARNLPVHLFIGDKDFLYFTAQDWKAKYEATAPVFDYVVYPGIGHNSWEYAYKDGFIFEWFSQFRRDLFPQEVTFSTRWFKYNKAYWVRFDDLTPGTLASISVKFTGPNNIEAKTGGLNAFTLSLDGHPLFNRDNKVNVIVDGKTFHVKTADAASFMKDGGDWVNRRYTPGLTSKRAGAEGPLYAAVSSNHVYVYGTGGNPSREELAARRDQAAAAADWSGMGGRIMVFPRVMADREIRQSDYETSNLILFGTRETNSVIEKYADRLPMHLDPAAADFGLVYIFPMNNHYIVVNSGLSWWTPPTKAQVQTGYDFSGFKIEALKKLFDFILFRVGPDNAVASGYFDNSWKLPPGAAEAMKNTGIVTVK